MEAIVKTPFLMEVAAKVGQWFPEFGGRSMAVSEASMDKETIKDLPIIMAAYDRFDFQAKAQVNQTNFKEVDKFVLEFWLKPVRHKRDDGSETPFWAFYDPNPIKDRLLSNILTWQFQGCEILEPTSMIVDSNEFAVTIMFAFNVHYYWKMDNSLVVDGVHPADGHPVRIQPNVCVPHMDYCGPCTETKEEPKC